MKNGHMIACLAMLLGHLVVQLPASFALDRAFESSRPYLAVDANGLGEIYARCTAGGTLVYRVADDKDHLIDRFDWYCSRFPKKLYLISVGWTKGRPDIAIYRPNNHRIAGVDPKKQGEFDLYFNGKHVRQFTTQQLVDLGAALKKPSGEHHRLYPDNAVYADFTFQGYDGYNAKESGGSGYFSFRMSKGNIVLIDVATGKVVTNPYPGSENRSERQDK